MEASITRSKKLITTLLFQCGWWLNIGGAKMNMIFAPFFFSILILSFYIFTLSTNKRKDIIIISAVTLYGFMSDTLLNYFNIFNFTPSQNIIPLWLISIWALFAMTGDLYEYLHNRKLIAFILGAISGPLSYAAGLKFDLLTFPQFKVSMIILSCLWGLNFLGFLKLKRIIFLK